MCRVIAQAAALVAAALAVGAVVRPINVVAELPCIPGGSADRRVGAALAVAFKVQRCTEIRRVRPTPQWQVEAKQILVAEAAALVPRARYADIDAAPSVAVGVAGVVAGIASLVAVPVVLRHPGQRHVPVAFAQGLADVELEAAALLAAICHRAARFAQACKFTKAQIALAGKPIRHHAEVRRCGLQQLAIAQPHTAPA
ncbi:hypothetical protein D3C73_1212900 [compost metagenome]